MEPIASSWTTRHGDSSSSPVWAVIADDGTAVDLTDWTVKAQLRTDVDATDPTYTFIVGNGVQLGTATVKLSSGRRIQTSTVQLYLLPSYYSNIPRPFTGVADVEISSDNTTTPLQRYTIVQLDVNLTRDVTR